MLFPKAIWKEIGGYDETMINGFEDWEYNIHLGKKGYHGICIEKGLFYYLVNEEGMLLSKTIKKYSQIWSYIQKKHKDLYSFRTIYMNWKQWRKTKSNNLIFSYIIIIIFHKILPSTLFNFIILILLKIKSYFRKFFKKL
tara:strand:- start:322 stop:741 length:420 start_codon:yes stop_codon:yes gene_type:complete